MIYPLYGIIVLSMTDDVSKDFKTIDIAREYFGEVTNNFSKFEPWQFKYELKEAMCGINNIVCDGKYYGKKATLSKKMLHEFANEIEKHINYSTIESIVKKHIDKHKLNKYNRLILGCTHYELVADIFKRECPNTEIICNSDYIINKINIIGEELNLVIMLSKKSDNYENKILSIIRR